MLELQDYLLLFLVLFFPPASHQKCRAQERSRFGDMRASERVFFKFVSRKMLQKVDQGWIQQHPEAAESDSVVKSKAIKET